MSSLAPPEPGSLGSDPFNQGDGTLPYLIRLRERTLRLVDDNGEPRAHRDPARSPDSVPHAPDLGPPVPEVPGIEEGEEPEGWLDRLAGLFLDEEDEERIAFLAASLGSRSFDTLGLCPRTTRRAIACFKLLYRHYFRVESTGHEVLPEKGGAILAANHGGLLPFDGAMTIVDVALHSNPPRLLRAIVDRWAGTLPFINVFYARVGQVIGTRENIRELLSRQQLVLAFPEGTPAISKPAAERYVLRNFRVGFVEEALRNRVPIVPVSIVGPDDQAPILYNIRPLARLLGLPAFPITPTFPILGPLGLIPYPVKYEIHYGEPFRFHEEIRDGSSVDPEAIHYMAEQVRHRVQEMVDRRVLERRQRRG